MKQVLYTCDRCRTKANVEEQNAWFGEITDKRTSASGALTTHKFDLCGLCLDSLYAWKSRRD